MIRSTCDLIAFFRAWLSVSLGAGFWATRDGSRFLASGRSTTQALPDRIVFYSNRGFLVAGPQRDGELLPPPKPEPLTGYNFEGYRNTDGTVGTKNILAVSTSVQCVAGTVDFALTRIRKELLPKYPNVDDVVALTHAYGCGDRKSVV